ncbi:retrotransposon protein, putative, ty1-copia subclass [Tanacetum coccineum]
MAARGQNQGNGKNKHAYAPKPKIPPPPKREDPAKDSICHECGETGHWKRNCPQYLAELLKKKKNAASGAGGSGIFTIELNTFLNRSWIYDTGCGTYICNTTQGLRASRKLKPGALSLYVGNGQREAVEAIGVFYLCLPSGLEIVLNNCHYAPSITRGVISVSRLYEDGFINRFVNNTIQVSRNNMVYFSAIPRDGIFEIDLSNSYANESSIYTVSNKRAKIDLDSALLWHCHLGHISKKRIEKLQHDGLLNSTDLRAFEKCIPCMSGKMTRKPYTHQDHGDYRPSYSSYTHNNNGVSERKPKPTRYVRSMKSPNNSSKSPRFWDYASRDLLHDISQIWFQLKMLKRHHTKYGMGKPQVCYFKDWGSEALVKARYSLTKPDEVRTYVLLSRIFLINQEARWSLEDLEIIQKKIYIPFYKTLSLNHEEDDLEIDEPQSDIIPIPIAAYYDYEIWQMDVKTAFLNGYLNEELRLSKIQGASTPAELKRMQNVPYASAMGLIMYAVRCTRLDVAFAQNITSRFQQNPGDLHWTTVKNILKYLRNTKDMFLVYEGDIKRELRVSCYTDAGYLTDADDLKSQTGYVFVLNGEAEYIAAYDASKEAVWVRKFISELGVVPTIEEPINMYCDNTGAITIANESGITKGARHLCAKVHYLREVIEFGDIKLEKVHTDDNLADPFTKALAFLKHSEHTKNIGMLPASSLMLYVTPTPKWELLDCDVFVAGTDTTFASLVWSITELIRHPRVMKKLQQEVTEIAQRRSMISENDLEKMQYLKATIKETLRMYPPLPLLLPHESTHDVKLMDYEIPSRTQIIVNAWAIGRDPTVWEEPEEFRPERFLNNSIDYNGLHYELLPFGSGRRGCPGIHFATVMFELALANVVYKFNLALPNEVEAKDLDMTETNSITLHKKSPLLVMATPRFQ